MTERPILFSGEMVRAILRGRKTQTRRVVQPHRSWYVHSVCDPAGAADPWAVWFHYPETERVGHLVNCPYGKPADRLWVREAWGNMALEGYPPVIAYRADPDDPANGWGLPPGMKWKPSIHMKRSDSRLNLEIASVRVERIQDISFEDALAEGMADYGTFVEAHRNTCCEKETGDEAARRLRWPQRDFSWLWDKINSKRGFGWDTNPWVWVITFKRIEKDA